MNMSVEVEDRSCISELFVVLGLPYTKYCITVLLNRKNETIGLQYIMILSYVY